MTKKLSPSEWVQISSNILAMAHIAGLLLLFGVHLHCEERITKQERRLQALEKKAGLSKARSDQYRCFEEVQQR